MKRLALTTGLIVAAACPAWADDSAIKEQTLGGVVPNVCRLGAVSQSSGDNASFAVGGASSTVTVTTFADPNTAQARAASINLGIQGVCNRSHTIRLLSERGGLTLDQPPAGATPGFARRVDYTAVAGWPGAQTTLTTAGAAGAAATVDVSGPSSGDLLLSIAIPSGSTALVAGDYRNRLTVELLANM